MLEEVNEKTKNNEEYIYKKLFGGYGIEIIQEYVTYLKQNNPSAEIKLKYHEPHNDLFPNIMLTTNQPLEELNKDNKARTRNVIREFELSNKKEYEDKMIEEPLRFNDLYTEAQFFEIVNQLRQLHPNCTIYAYYNTTDKKVGKILPDGISFENLKFDQVHIRNQNGNSYGIDADGYIGIRPDAITTYTPNGEDMYRPSITKEKNYKTYYGNSLYANIKGNDVNDIELESMKKFFENMEKENTNKLNKMSKNDKEEARERVRFETMSFEEDIKKRRDKFNQFISMMKTLNPNVEFDVESNEYHTVIYTSASMNQLKFPEGFKETGTNNVSNPNSFYDSTYYFEEMKKTKSDASLSNGEKKDNLSQSSADKLLEMEEQRKFTILQRERVMNEAQRGKNRSALMAGICMLGAATALYFKNIDTTAVIQHELEALQSWKLQDLGPLTTVLAAGAGGFIGKYFKYSKKFKKAQNGFIDMNNSMMIQSSQDSLGGEENAKSR